MTDDLSIDDDYGPETASAEQFLRQQYPSAVSFVRIRGAKERQLGNLALHHRDLLYAFHCLATLNQVHDDQHAGLIQESLWRGAVIYFIKCFGRNASRSSLNADKIFTKEEQKIRYKFFSSLRDKHLVHDENAYTNYHIVLAINPEPSVQKIAAVDCVRSISYVRTAERVTELYDLVETARRWVRKEIEKLKTVIKAEREQTTRAELLALEKLTIAPVLWSDVHKPRET